MNRVFSHFTRLISKFWLILCIGVTISPAISLVILIIATGLSIALFDDPAEAKTPTDYFTEEEWRKIQNDEEVDAEEYLILLAKLQSYKCPVKVDQVTTWTSSEVTKDSFICNYEINDKWHRYGTPDMNVVKNNILTQIDPNTYKVQCIIATNRNMIFRYWNCQTETFENIVLSKEELMNLF